MNPAIETAPAPAPSGETHVVSNQAAPAAGFNAFDSDAVLTAALEREAPWARGRASALGRLAGDESVQELASLANRHLPELRTHDRYGNRIDWVEFHPAWHELMDMAFGHGVHALAWTAGQPGAHYARAVLSYLWNQVENGVGCPAGMAYAAVAGFADYPSLALWKERVMAHAYDRRRLPVREKKGAVIAYAMTEKQGGSDLRATVTTARYLESGEHGTLYLITGHKWFCSVPVADGIFTLARTGSGVSCFFVPRILPDGNHNTVLIQRLKDKAGNRSNASSEIEYRDTVGILVGEEGHGIREILTHAHLTRLDFAVASAGLMRLALTLALNHCQSRTAFRSSIAERPMQRNVLADLAVDCEASTLMALRLARAADGMDADPAERALVRIGTPMAKFWNCKRAPAFVAEALECHGGNGFIEESPVARLYREAPLNAIWEGTSNMMCMDVLRAATRHPDTVQAFLAEVGGARGADRRYDRFIDRLPDLLAAAGNDEGLARRAAGAMAAALQGAELVRHSTPEVADAFCASRLDGDWGGSFGTLHSSPALAAIVERATVVRH